MSKNILLAVTKVTRVISSERADAVKYADNYEMHTKTLETMNVGIKLTEQVVVAQTEAAKLYTAGTVLTSLCAVGVGVGLIIGGCRIGGAVYKAVKK